MWRLLIGTLALMPVLCDAQDEQSCDKNSLDLAGNHFNVKEIETSACKVWPFDRNKTIGAFFYRSSLNHLNDDRDWGTFGVLIIEDKEVISWHKEKEPRWSISSLEIDTARYDLNKDTRAFGVDINDAYRANCADGWVDHYRNLYITNESSIRPIMKNIYMDSSLFIKGGGPRCYQGDDSIIKNTRTSISIGELMTNGFSNLVLTRKSTFDNDPEKLEITKEEYAYRKNEYYETTQED